MAYASRNPYVLLSLLIAVVLGIAAVRAKEARVIVTLWAVLFLLFVGFFSLA